jgi:hypothetical protein
MKKYRAVFSVALMAVLAFGIVAVVATPDSESASSSGPQGGKRCGGFAGIPCPNGLICIDDPRDDCDPKTGGADCIGICRPGN